MTEERWLAPQPEIYAVGCFSQNLTTWAVISLLNSLLGSSGNSLKQTRNETVDRTLQVWLRHIASTARSRVTFEKTQRKKTGRNQQEIDEKSQVVSCHCGRNALHQNGLPREVSMCAGLLRIDAGEKTM